MNNFEYLYNSNDAEITRLFNVERLVNKKLGFKVIENGTILPIKSFSGKVAGLRGVHGGIIDNNQKFVSNSFVTFRTDASYPIPPAPESIIHRSDTVVYLGMFYPVWGHVLTDDICFLWFLKSDEYKSQFKDCPLVYISWSRTSETVNANFRRLLEILEIDPDSFKPITQPTQFAKIIVPDRSFSRIPRDMGKLFTNEYRDTIDRIRTFALKNRTPTTSKKIYYFYGSKQFGEERLAEYFRSKGYEIVRPEKLTVDEQLNLLINCDSFASTIGSVSHNALFLRDNSQTILIPRAAYHSMQYQLTLDQVHPLNVNYVDSSLSLFYRNTGPNCFIISKQLRRFFGDKFDDKFDDYDEEDFKIFLQYVKTSLSKGREIDFSLREYYNAILPDFLAQLKRHEDLIKAYKMPSDWERLFPTLTYQTNILDVQAVKIKYPGHKIYYSVCYDNEESWSEEVSNDQMAGITGNFKSIKIWLGEASTKEFDILYRVHKFDGEWTDWAKNGKSIYLQGVKLNALQIKLEPKRM